MDKKATVLVEKLNDLIRYTSQDEGSGDYYMSRSEYKDFYNALLGAKMELARLLSAKRLLEGFRNEEDVDGQA